MYFIIRSLVATNQIIRAKFIRQSVKHSNEVKYFQLDLHFSFSFNIQINTCIYNTQHPISVFFAVSQLHSYIRALYRIICVLVYA